MTIPRIDVLVPVYNSLHHARPCLETVAATVDLAVDRVTILDDASDKHTRGELGVLADRHGFELLESPRNQGFVRNCNRGMERSEGRYVVLLNSDTLVTSGWTDKMVAAVETDPSIGVASPISNFCPHMRIDMIPGHDFRTMNELIEELSPRSVPDITTPEGFCFMVTRRCMESIGYFDLAFDDGYGEESDYSMRANANGFRTVCVDDTYIYHRGRGTFGEEQREQKYLRNKEIFQARWAEHYRRGFEDMKARDPLGTLRSRVKERRQIHGPRAFVR